MNINNMSDQEKSTLLVRLARPLGDSCPAVYDDESDYEYLYDAGDCPCERKNLYLPIHMALARYVLVWASHSGLLSQVWRETIAVNFAYGTDGIRTALDAVLTLAIEAGMIPE